MPHLPGRLVLGPQVVQVLVLAISIHGVEETVVFISHQLALGSQLFQWLTLQYAVISAEVFENIAPNHKEPRADAAFASRLLDDLQTTAIFAGLDNPKPETRPHGPSPAAPTL